MQVSLSLKMSLLNQIEKTEIIDFKIILKTQKAQTFINCHSETHKAKDSDHQIKVQDKNKFQTCTNFKTLKVQTCIDLMIRL